MSKESTPRHESAIGNKEPSVESPLGQVWHLGAPLRMDNKGEDLSGGEGAGHTVKRQSTGRMDAGESEARSSLVNPAEESTKPAAQSPRYRFYDFDGAHLHTLDKKPLIGTSTACRVLGKPGLVWWSAGMALTPLGWLNKNKSKKLERILAASKAAAKIRDMTYADYADFLQDCYRAHDTRKKTAAVTGTDMHAELEKYVKECIYENAGQPIFWTSDSNTEVYRFAEWATDNVQEFLWSEAHCYSERLWTGGICDAGAMLKNGKLAILDFKSNKETYYDYFVQAGGYALAIEENGLWTADGAPVGICHWRADTLIVFPFGSDEGPRIETNVEGYMQRFEACVLLHKGKQEFEK